MCANFNNYVIGFVLNKVSLLKGNIYSSDSFFYYSNNLDELTNLEYRTPHQSIYNQLENKLLLGFNYADSTEIGIKWHSAIFSYSPYKMLPYSLDQDTFDTKIEGLYDINGIRYAVVFAINPISKLENIVPYSILKLGDDTLVTPFFTYLNKQRGASAHRVTIDKLSADNQNPSNLLLTVTDQWDWAGDPQSFQTDIVKMDTTGKVIWSSRPNLNWDSVNTTGFQMVQKPNGNILCSWLDLYYRP